MNIEHLYHKFLESNVLKHIKKRIKTLLVIFLLMTAVVLVIAWFRFMLRPVNTTNRTFIKIEVDKGKTAEQLAREMQKLGIIKNSFAFKLYAQIDGNDANIKSGKYYLSPSMTSKQILNKLIKGETINNDVKITFPEGSKLSTIAEIYSKKGLITESEFFDVIEIERFKKKYDFMKDFPLDASLEGFLFPDTYFFPRDRNADFYLDLMLKRFKEVYFDKIDKVLKENNNELSLYQIVTLASIVEAEAKLESERPIIAGIFYNRLKKGMPLQSCATVAFIMGKHKEILSLADLKIDSPYNTYKNEGLPPGPIGAPGLSSMLAVANPADVDYLYLVAKGDGSHIFSITYAEHLEAQKKIQKNKL